MVKVMVVDDSNLMVAVISNFIKKDRSDIEIISAHNGLEALNAYKVEKPDLVFMDIKMPELDGLKALEEIRKFDGSAKVVMCTALKTIEQEETATKLGAVKYITKPFSRDDIVETLKEFL